MIRVLRVDLDSVLHIMSEDSSLGSQTQETSNDLIFVLNQCMSTHNRSSTNENRQYPLEYLFLNSGHSFLLDIFTHV
jgi:hypothetical protein